MHFQYSKTEKHHKRTIYVDMFSERWKILLAKAMYDSDNILADWLISTFVAMPKKSNAMCMRGTSAYQLHDSFKAFLKIIYKRIYSNFIREYKRIYSKCEQKSGDIFG